MCGGCTIQHLAYTEQLSLKDLTLRARLAPAIAGLPYATREASLFVPLFDDDDPWQFRQKVAFSFAPGPGGGGIVMGHYERGSNRIVPVEECPVHSARGNRIAFALRDQLVRAGIGAAGTASPGILRHVIVRTTHDDREAVAMLVVTRNDRALRAPVRALLESPDRPDGFLLNLHPKGGAFMVGPETIAIEGPSHVRETVGGYSYLVSPAAFFQTNVRAAAALQRLVLAGVGRAARVLDLYCGSGLFTIPLAAAGARVVGVESNRQAAADAEANRKLNRIDRSRARFVAARVEDALGSLSHRSWDAAILDPPRQGCPRAVLTAVFERIAPARVAYVSCNPEALAAELPVIRAAGYGVEDLRAIDMFPHTEHVEAVVVFSRRSSSSPAR